MASIINGGYVTRKAQKFCVGIRWEHGSQWDWTIAYSRQEAWSYFARTYKGAKLFSFHDEHDMTQEEKDQIIGNDLIPAKIDWSSLDLY